MQLLQPKENPFDSFQSHPDKPLRVHTQGVIDGTSERSDSPVAMTAALFHDTGKLNPNFQRKLKSEKVREYSKHAYLSALAFACFCKRNKLSSLGYKSKAQRFATLAVIAHHHGHLPNMDDIFSLTQCEELHDFLQSGATLPCSDFLQQWLPHQSFSLQECSTSDLQRLKLDETLGNPLELFFETQWAFASLIHADKRDAGNNATTQKSDELQHARSHFSHRLNADLQQKSESTSELNLTRTKIREVALQKLHEGLSKGKRTFSLTAPTGAGKTLMLLAIADAIRVLEHKPSSVDLGVIYALPFLSITEQVEGVCGGIFQNDLPITRSDSRAQNPRLEELLEEAEDDPQAQDELIKEKFAADTFDHAFIVTTFVQLCETLMSNRNARLLKLPNFRRTIFLLDEIQALPPRLYTFFVAHLQEFCERFDCYAVFSTATMPSLEFADKKLDAKRDPKQLFRSYEKPLELAGKEHFEYSIFDRYQIRRVSTQKISREELVDQIIEADNSCLVVLNTIEDTRLVHALLCERLDDDEVLLLNTHFTPHHRRRKLETCRERLRDQQRVILVSTQLIEAGVDISFPRVFRDMCPLPNLVQCAGRCNRHGEGKRGIVWFFELAGENGQSRAELIYKDAGSFIAFSRDEIPAEVDEKALLQVQQRFFEKVRDNLSVGDHGDMNLIEKINVLAFKDLGRFQLIDEREFGTEKRYYISGQADDEWETLQELATMRPQGRDFGAMRQWQIKVESCLRKLNEHVVTARFGRNKELPSTEETFGLSRLSEFDYDSQIGLKIGGAASAIL